MCRDPQADLTMECVGGLLARSFTLFYLFIFLLFLVSCILCLLNWSHANSSFVMVVFVVRLFSQSVTGSCHMLILWMGVCGVVQLSGLHVVFSFPSLSISVVMCMCLIDRSSSSCVQCFSQYSDWSVSLACSSWRRWMFTSCLPVSQWSSSLFTTFSLDWSTLDACSTC